MIERYFTIKELAERLKTSLEKTRLMVKDEPGVLRILPEPSHGKTKTRPKTMYRIRKRGRAHPAPECQSGARMDGEMRSADGPGVYTVVLAKNGVVEDQVTFCEVCGVSRPS